MRPRLRDLDNIKSIAGIIGEVDFISFSGSVDQILPISEANRY